MNESADTLQFIRVGARVAVAALGRCAAFQGTVDAVTLASDGVRYNVDHIDGCPDPDHDIFVDSGQVTPLDAGDVMWAENGAPCSPPRHPVPAGGKDDLPVGILHGILECWKGPPPSKPTVPTNEGCPVPAAKVVKYLDGFHGGSLELLEGSLPFMAPASSIQAAYERLATAEAGPLSLTDAIQVLNDHRHGDCNLWLVCNGRVHGRGDDSVTFDQALALARDYRARDRLATIR